MKESNAELVELIAGLLCVFAAICVFCLITPIFLAGILGSILVMAAWILGMDGGRREGLRQGILKERERHSNQNVKE